MPKQSWKRRVVLEQRAFEAWLERREIVLARRIGASRNRLIKAIASGYAISPTSEWRLVQRKHAEEIERILVATYRKVIPEQAERTLDNIRGLKFLNYDGYFERLIQKWIMEFATERAESISATTAADVKRAIDKAVQSGKGNREIAKEIRKVALLTPHRALTVARTETHGAALFASETIAHQAQSDFGIVLTKHWVSTLDARTRDAHAAMSVDDGKRMNEDFIVGGVPMSRPGDPRGGAANVINCRCSLIYREVEYDIE